MTEYTKIKVLGIDRQVPRNGGNVEVVLSAQTVMNIRIKFKDASQLNQLGFYERNVGKEVMVALRTGALDNGKLWFAFDGDGDPFVRDTTVIERVDVSTGEIIRPAEPSDKPKPYFPNKAA